MKRKQFLLPLAFLTVFVLNACGNNTQIAQESHDYPFYVNSPDNKKTINLTFFKGQKDIPYISLETLKDLLESTMADSGEKGFALSRTDSGQKVTFTRENKASASFDFLNDNITFSNYDLFNALPCSKTALDIDSSDDLDANNQNIYLQRQNDKGFYRPGAEMVLDLKDYDLSIYYQGGKGYVPLALASDFFFATYMPTLSFNGESAFLFPGSMKEFSDIYYQVSPKAVSAELSAFSYHELCLTLDHLYGLKKQHGINNFDTVFSQNGFKTDFLGTDPIKQDIAYEKLAYAVLADFHSNFVANSPFAGKESTPSKQEGITTYGSPSYLNKFAAFTKVGMAQATAFPQGCPSYQVIGDTAYVTFNSFVGLSQDYYLTAPNEEAADTFGICAYAHKQITNNSSIKNVVLDLSANTGGESRAALFTLAWFLGEASVSIQSAATGGVATTVYRADLNLDHVFDEKDTLEDKNLFCLISPMSFSSGNLVPSFFKNSGKVTLLGQNSGGGACNIQSLVTGTGTYLTISSQRVLSRVFNGSYYDIDQGVAPDYPIVNLNNFYDRTWLTNMIDSIK
ncbi:MAG: S41 family peptidase [Bacilli bacterium]|jgi:hypothetical protein|nr:S41 family peptidase [Bacilli bacterium]